MDYETICKEIKATGKKKLTQQEVAALCHLSKKTIYKLERFGVLPYEEHVDRLIHTHVIKTTDVLTMLKERHCKQSSRSLYIKTMTHYYKRMLRKEPDVLELNDIIRMTGFSKSGVLNWLLHGDLPSIRSGRFYLVPKRYLLDFLRSPTIAPSRINPQSKRRIWLKLSASIAWPKRQVVWMSEYKHLLKLYPEYVSKEDFRIIAHISKQTARCLLKCGLVPCQYTGKKTRCYQIKMTDVIAYLENRERAPALYSPANYPLFKQYSSGMRLAVDEKEYKQLREYLATTLSDYPDAMLLEDVARYTGYRSCSICTWVNNGKLKHIPYGSSKIIPKEYLLDFLASKDGLNRKNKTTVFNDLINGFLTWKLQHRK